MAALKELALPPLSPLDLVRYAGASGDFNPLHTQESVGREAGFGGVIAHGLLVMGLAGRFIAENFPGHTLRRYRVRFVSVTRPGEPLVVSGRLVGRSAESGHLLCSLEVRGEGERPKLQGDFEVAAP